MRESDRILHLLLAGAACVFSASCGTDLAADAAGPSAAPRPGRGPGKVKVFVLTGQSNMTGRGPQGRLDQPAADQKATLVHFIKRPENVEKYRSLYTGEKKDANGWTIRDDVFVSCGEWPHAPGLARSHWNKHGGLAPGYGGRRAYGFGPEFGIGFVLGERYDETVLLVKISFGGNNLARDFRPPSSGGTTGPRYETVVKTVKDSVANLPEIVPGYTDERGYEIAGMFWNQGESDMLEPLAGEYEENLVNLIKDLRGDLDAPDMKAVIAVTGYEGWKGKPSHDPVARKVIEAQFAVARRPEFRGTVATTETRDFWRPREEFGGRGMSIHWNANGESYWLMGEAMGLDMIGLLEVGR